MNRGAMRYDGTPDAPFRKDWPVQMFRRALKEAVMDGKEWVGFTTGETQVQRYDLRKEVKEIFAEKILYGNRAGDYDIRVVDKSGKENASILNENELPEYIGKELASKIIEESSNNPDGKTYSGLNLAVGGEGMKNFYDRILPNEVNKYVKQYGGIVVKEKIQVPRFTKTEPDIFGDYETPKGRRVSENTEIWKVEITTEMRDGLKQLDEIEKEIRSRSPNSTKKQQIQFSPKTLTDDEFTAT